MNWSALKSPAMERMIACRHKGKRRVLIDNVEIHHRLNIAEIHYLHYSVDRVLEAMGDDIAQFTADQWNEMCHDARTLDHLTSLHDTPFAKSPPVFRITPDPKIKGLYIPATSGVCEQFFDPTLGEPCRNDEFDAEQYALSSLYELAKHSMAVLDEKVKDINDMADAIGRCGIMKPVEKQETWRDRPPLL